MNNPYYEMSVPVAIAGLKNLKVFLAKGEAFAKAKKISEETMLGERIIADMLPLSAQIQLASDHAKALGAWLAGIPVPKMEDNEQTFADLYARIDKTIAFLETLKSEEMQDAARRKVKFHYFGNKHMLGADYLRFHAIPNFFFHVTTAYNILRQNGVEIGKTDYVGAVFPLQDD